MPPLRHPASFTRQGEADNDMSMYLQTGIILAVMVAAFGLSLKLFKMPPELAMIASAVAGLLASWPVYGELDEPVRHLVEGSTTYLDIILVVVAATIFMNILKESGALYAMIRSVVRAFARRRILLLVFVMLLVLIPGALTGAGSTSILISGQIAAIVLGCMGVPLVNVAAIVFIGAVLSVAAPPVNIYAMIICGGVNMPYVGFFVPLGLSVLALAVFSVLFLGWKGTPLDVGKVMEELPPAPPRMRGFRVYVPLLVLLALMTAVRAFPHAMPVLGIPLQFLISTVAALVVAWASATRINVLAVSRQTLAQLFPLIATLVAIGMLVQVMSLTGVRGLFVITILTLPLLIVYAGLMVGLPLGEAVLLYGVAAVLGVPLVLLFNSLAKGAILVTAGISLICPLGDALPPTAILGRLTVRELGYTGSYGSFLKKTVVPWVAVTAVGLLMVVLA